MNKIAVKLTYKENGTDRINSDDLAHLHKEIKENYISNITPNAGPQSGGMVDAIVEVLMDISLIDFFKIVRDGFIFDTVTRREESFILKPLFNAFKNIEAKNSSWDYCSVTFLFDGTEVVISGMSNLFTSKIATVFTAISEHYNNITSEGAQAPHQILIPIRKEEDEQGKTFFANYGAGDDYELEEYTEYWGISYAYGFATGVYDLKKGELLKESWRY